MSEQRLCKVCENPLPKNARWNQDYHRGKCWRIHRASRQIDYWNRRGRKLRCGYIDKAHNGAASPTLEYHVALAGWSSMQLERV